MKTAIINTKLVLPYRVVEGGLLLEDGKIAAVLGNEVHEAEQIIDAKGRYVSPGFIDIHTHGGGGHDYMDGTVEAFTGAARAHMQHGTTALLPTPLTCSDEELFNVFEVFRQVKFPVNQFFPPNSTGPRDEGFTGCSCGH